MAFSFRKSSKNKPASWQYYKSVPFTRLWPLYAAVFCLFAITGFFGDMLNLGHMPYVLVILNAICSGFTALMYLHVGTRLRPRFFIVATLLQIPLWLGFSVTVAFLTSRFHLQPVSTTSGIRFAGVVMLLLVVLSYSLFIRFLRGEGRNLSVSAMSLSLHTAFRRRLFLQSHCAPRNSSCTGVLTRAIRLAATSSMRCLSLTPAPLPILPTSPATAWQRAF